MKTKKTEATLEKEAARVATEKFMENAKRTKDYQEVQMQAFMARNEQEQHQEKLREIKKRKQRIGRARPISPSAAAATYSESEDGYMEQEQKVGRRDAYDLPDERPRGRSSASRPGRPRPQQGHSGNPQGNSPLDQAAVQPSVGSRGNRLNENGDPVRNQYGEPVPVPSRPTR